MASFQGWYDESQPSKLSSCAPMTSNGLAAEKRTQGAALRPLDEHGKATEIVLSVAGPAPE